MLMLPDTIIIYLLYNKIKKQISLLMFAGFLSINYLLVYYCVQNKGLS